MEFEGMEKRPVLSCLRSFSAPVILKTSQSKEELAFIMSHDSDLFSRWDAACRLGVMIILDSVENHNGSVVELDEVYVEAFRNCLSGKVVDKALAAQTINLPAETYIAQQMRVIEPGLLHQARNSVISKLRTLLLADFKKIYYENSSEGEYDISSAAMGRRSLKNSCLRFIMAGNDIDQESLDVCLEQYRNSKNMTDTMGALAALMDYNGEEREAILTDFYERWKEDALVVDKWFTLQAVSSLGNTLERVKELMSHPAFSIKNPNKVRSLIGAFCSGNHVRFHDSSGAGYRFLAEQILTLDAINPQIAARLVSPFTSWKRYDKKRRALMHEQLKYLVIQKPLSADVSEIVQKSL